MNKTAMLIIIVLLAAVAALSWMLWAKQVEAPSVTDGTTTMPTPTPTPPGTPTPTPTPTPLHERVSVSTPKANATVGKKFSITGKAPGNWFFEASAPYMVQTPQGDKVAQGTLQTIGDWMTTELVDFKADVSITGSYTGPAVLVLMKDNPSGMPENEDSLEIPITIQ